MSKISDKYLIFCIYLVLAAAALAVYWQVYSYDFINYDDNEYVTGNLHVQAGLTHSSVIWAFTTGHTGNWHPLTWLSHMLDCQLFGTNPGRHHLINLLFHIVNTLLLFAIFNQMTGTLWQSAFVAAAFALHPLHVESIAWIAERKDVLSTLFWLLTMAAYLRYVRRPGAGRYLMALLLFALGLMAKPMLVTLPFVLLLLDYWPLERFQLNRNIQWPVILRLVREKIPFFALATVSSVVTFLVQQRGGAVVMVSKLTLNFRIANTFISYAKYIGKTAWPTRLAVFYPYPLNTIPVWQVIAAAILLLAVSIWIIYLSRRYKYLPVGWFWYLGTLVPVIGLVQVGEQALADRYTYVSLTGLFIIVAWGLPDLLTGWKYRKIALGILSLMVFLALAICARFQVGHWRSSKSLFEHALEVTAGNYSAHSSLANVLYEQGEIDHAIAHNLEAIRIYPAYPEAHNNLGIALDHKGKIDEAIAHFNEALRVRPNYGEVHNNLGSSLIQQGKFDEAITHLNKALLFKPDSAEVHVNISIVYLKQGKLDEVVTHLTEALKIKPDMVNPMNGLAWLLATQQDAKFYNPQRAIQLAQRACELTGYQNAGTMDTLAVAYAAIGRFPEAVAAAEKALRLAESSQQKTKAELIQYHLYLFKMSKPYIETLPK